MQGITLKRRNKMSTTGKVRPEKFANIKKKGKASDTQNLSCGGTVKKKPKKK